ncbi:endolytic transglycosylase MltG [Aureimonas mangrovi]|uniref:endolytic transglycosylase MltG n=1 Tax=Aureimonas mangrovi TaxID=2758041 RepID=UPI001FE793CC|nr:endolytic transglycosylase MltG [Aureimonas mangrovi]
MADSYHPAETRRGFFSRRPKQRRRSNGARNSLVIFLSFCFTMALIAVVVGGVALYWGKGEYERAGPLQAEAVFLVPRGSGLQNISTGLEAEGIISSAELFQAAARVSGAAGDLKAGEYEFEPGASMRSVMEAIRDGRSVQHAVAMPEGWTVDRVWERIEGNEALTGEMPEKVAEGALLPDTYTFTRGETRASIVARMVEAQRALVQEIWDGRDEGLPIDTIEEFVTLASIVERETGVAAERPHVASVFINRLRQGMRLQSDPTFIYGIWGGAGKPPEEPLRRSHIESDTPYNTYRINGLPPGPIANPGRAALEAVAHPLETDDLYFVADGTGGHAFARTLEEHNANVRAYRALMAERAAAPPDVAAEAEEDATLVE